MNVYTGASMSLDGFIAGPEDSGFEHLFAWMVEGDVKVETADPEMTMSMTQDNAEHFRRLQDVGAIVVGRHLYDLTNGWGGQHPLGCAVVVLTHNPPEEPPGPDFHFVSTGIEDAVAKAVELAGDKDVGVNAGEMAQLCLEAGLLDEVWIELAPVFLGTGKPFFTGVLDSPLVLDGPETFPGTGVSHLRYRVRK